jgi:hypothetical protein
MNSVVEKKTGQDGLFEFKQCVSLTKSLGKKAKNLHELREHLETASDESIAHHTYRYFLSGHALEYTNDFAHWVAQSLGEKGLSEHLSNIDPYSVSVGNLRQELLRPIDDRLNQPPEPRDAMSGEEFYFAEALLMVFPAGIRVRNLAEFLMGIRYVDISSIYYHFYEARRRLPYEPGDSSTDDFSAWFFKSLQHSGLVEIMKTVDPFMHTLEGIRTHIMEAVEDAVRKDMEGLLQ